METDLLASSFPVSFDNGYTVDSLAFWCTRCGRMAKPANVHGQTSRILPDTVDVWASARCICGHHDTHRIRLKDDKSCIYISGGEWKRISKKSLQERIRGFLYKFTYLLKFRWKCFLLKRSVSKLEGVIRKTADNYRTAIVRNAYSRP